MKVALCYSVKGFSMSTILVQMSDKQWTMQAIHLACALARNSDGNVVLLDLMQVTHPGYLGTGLGYTPLTPDQSTGVHEYTSTAEDYGIQLSFKRMQCVSVMDAIVEAAEYLTADVVFAHIPESRFSFWHSYQRWDMKRRLVAAHRQLFSLDRIGQSVDQPPTIIVRPAYPAAGKPIVSSPAASK